MMSEKRDQQELLRVKAEARLAEKQISRKPMRPTEELLHELQVHQIELEMQNEELRRIQIELEEARDIFVDLYEFAPVGYITLSQQSQITAINLTGAALLREDRRQLLQRSFARIVSPEDRDRWRSYISEAFIQRDSLPGELTLLRKDGTRFNVRLDSRLIAVAGASVLRITLIDISAQIHLDRMLHERNIELVSARFMADKANQAKSEFLSSMSHELRSPLNAILGFAQLLETGSPLPTPGQKERIQHIIQAGWYLLELINEILDLTLIESGKLSLNLEVLNISKKLNDVQSMIQMQAQENGIQIKFRPLDNTLFVKADRIRLKQILVNLLSNAIKYNRAQGSVEVTCHTNTANYLRVSVRDTGAGLSPEKIAQLFQPFNRLGQENSAVQGTGIGLIVSKRLIEMMEGRIGAESIVGVGSEFWIELPLATGPPPIISFDEPSMPVQAAAQPAAEMLERRSMTRSTVLYVEDSPTNMLLVEQFLDRRIDLQLLKAENGADGLAMAIIHLPRVILLDINLPGISGIQLLKYLQLDEATAHIPVIAISANAMVGDIENGLAAGFFRYITKPIQLNVLTNVLDDALKATQAKSNKTSTTGNI